jgi:steroid 5-alpha reductase family enzyme
MKPADRTALVSFPVIVLLGAFIAWAGSQQGVRLAGLPVFGLSVGMAFLIQWLAFIPAYLKRTEKFFDLTGSLTYIGVTVFAWAAGGKNDPRTWILAALVIVWAVRLGTFLFHRIRKAGRDDRFDEIKPSFIRFLNAWTLQGLWVTFTASAALIPITSSSRRELDAFAVVGLLVWVFGFAFEVIADHQKSRFNTDPTNKGKFIRTGLWAKSRHPNYFGEIVLWLGVAIIAIPVLQGWQWIAMLSPVFVAALLTRLSGIPMLEAKADQKWGGQPDYEEYKRRTPVLIPRF